MDDAPVAVDDSPEADVDAWAPSAPEPIALPRWLRHVSSAGVALASCAIAVFVMGVGARDDDYITYWAAEQLAKTGSFVNINGARVEQSSSLAHVLVLAALYWATGAALPLLGYLVGIASLFFVVLGTARLARRVSPRAELWTAVAVGLSYPIVFWATGGLETVFAAACVVWFLLALDSVVRRAQPGLPRMAGYAGACLLVVSVRPDTAIVAAVLVVALMVLAVLQSRKVALAAKLPGVAVAAAVRALAGVAGAVVLVEGFRLVEFHRLLPQPEFAKAGGLSWFSHGFSYVFSSFPWWLWLTYVVFLVVGARVALRSESPTAMLALGMFSVGCLGIMFTRGDWMGGARLLVPYLAPGILAMVVGATSLPSAAWRQSAVVFLVAVECVAAALFIDGASWISSSYLNLTANPHQVVAADLGSPFGATSFTSTNPVPSMPWYTSWDFIHWRDTIFLHATTPILRDVLEHAPSTGPRITVGSYQAGMVAYTWANDFPKRIHFIDMDGLVNDEFSRCAGLTQSFSGNVVSFPMWIKDAGTCAPPLPDLVFMLLEPSAVPGLLQHYRIIDETQVSYVRRGLFKSPTLYGLEFLAARKGWNPPGLSVVTTPHATDSAAP